MSQIEVAIRLFATAMPRGETAREKTELTCEGVFMYSAVAGGVQGLVEMRSRSRSTSRSMLRLRIGIGLRFCRVRSRLWFDSYDRTVETCGRQLSREAFVGVLV